MLLTLFAAATAIRLYVTGFIAIVPSANNNEVTLVLADDGLAGTGHVPFLLFPPDYRPILVPTTSGKPQQPLLHLDCGRPMGRLDLPTGVVLVQDETGGLTIDANSVGAYAPAIKTFYGNANKIDKKFLSARPHTVVMTLRGAGLHVWAPRGHCSGGSSHELTEYVAIDIPDSGAVDLVTLRDAGGSGAMLRLQRPSGTLPMEMWIKNLKPIESLNSELICQQPDYSWKDKPSPHFKMLLGLLTNPPTSEIDGPACPRPKALVVNIGDPVCPPAMFP